MKNSLAVLLLGLLICAVSALAVPQASAVSAPADTYTPYCLDIAQLVDYNCAISI